MNRNRVSWWFHPSDIERYSVRRRNCERSQVNTRQSTYGANALTGSGTIYAEEGKFTGVGTVYGCGRGTGTFVDSFPAKF